MARKVSTKVAAISGISALAVAGLFALTASNSASADNLLNPSNTAAADVDGDFGHHGDHMDGDVAGGSILDRTETFINDAGVVTTHTFSTGTVTAINGNSITYTNADGESITVTAGDATIVERDGAAATVADIQVDDLVGVDSETVDGTTTVESIFASSTGTLSPGLGHHGPGHGGDMGDMMKERGKRVNSETKFKDADGNIITQIEYEGEVTSVDNNSITITLADGSSVTIDVNDTTAVDKSHTTVALTDLVATDHVRVDVVDGIATHIGALTADEFASFGDMGPGHHGGGMVDNDGDRDPMAGHGGGHHGHP